MHKFVHHHVVAACGVFVGIGNVLPAQHHRAALHGLAQQDLRVFVHHARLVHHLPPGHGFTGVDHDGHEIVVPVQGLGSIAQVQQGQAGLRRNVDGHGIGHFQPMGAVELLLVQKECT